MAQRIARVVVRVGGVVWVGGWGVGVGAGLEEGDSAGVQVNEKLRAQEKGESQEERDAQKELNDIEDADEGIEEEGTLDRMGSENKDDGIIEAPLNYQELGLPEDCDSLAACVDFCLDPLNEIVCAFFSAPEPPLGN